MCLAFSLRLLVKWLESLRLLGFILIFCHVVGFGVWIVGIVSVFGCIVGDCVYWGCYGYIGGYFKVFLRFIIWNHLAVS